MSTKKVCSYKGCNSGHINDKNSRETFFQFPRDEERYQIWLKNGKCDETESIGPRYFCSKHFDERKYISSNPRRKLLLHNAVPYEYNSDYEGEEQLNDIGSSDYIELDMEQNIDTLSDQEDDQKFSYCQKRPHSPIAIDDLVDDTTKIVRFEYQNNLETKLFKDIEGDLVSRSLPNDEEDQTRNSNKNNITTFIYQGEEYIQMPKRIYMSEKEEYLRKIKYYKSILTNLRDQIIDIEV